MGKDNKDEVDLGRRYFPHGLGTLILTCIAACSGNKHTAPSKESELEQKIKKINEAFPDSPNINNITINALKEDITFFDALYKELSNKEKPALLVISATWCGPCRKEYKDVLMGWAIENQKNFRVLYAVVDEDIIPGALKLCHLVFNKGYVDGFPGYVPIIGGVPVTDSYVDFEKAVAILEGKETDKNIDIARLNQIEAKARNRNIGINNEDGDVSYKVRTLKDMFNAFTEETGIEVEYDNELAEMDYKFSVTLKPSELILYPCGFFNLEYRVKGSPLKIYISKK